MAKVLKDFPKELNIKYYDDGAGGFNRVITVCGEVSDSVGGNEYDKGPHEAVDNSNDNATLVWAGATTLTALEAAMDTALKSKGGVA